MRRFLLRLIVAVTVLLTATGTALLIPSVQEWARLEVEQLSSTISGKTVSIGHIGGAPPLLFSFSDVAVREKEELLFSANHIRFIPAWFDLVIGHFSLLHLHIDGATVKVPTDAPRAKSGEIPLVALLPKHPIQVYSFSCTNIKIDRGYCLKGHFLWNPKRKHLACTLKGETAPRSGKLPELASLTLNAWETKISLTLNANLPEFVFEGTKGLKIELQADSAHPYFLEKMWGKTTAADYNVPYFQGGGTLWTILPNLGSLRAKSSFTLAADSRFIFAISNIYSDFGVMNGSLEGTIENKNQEYILLMKSRNFQSSRFHFANIEARLLAKNENDALHGSLNISGQLSQLPLNFSANWSTDRKTHLALTDCKGTFASTLIETSFDYHFSPRLLLGKCELHSSNIGPIASLFGRTLHGKAAATLTFTPDHTALSNKVQGNFELDKFHALSFGFEKITGAIEGTARDSDCTLTLGICCENGHAKHIEIGTLRVAATLDTKKQAAPFEIQAEGKIDSGRFALVSRGSMGNTTMVDKFDFAFEGRSSRLGSPLIAHIGKEFEIEPFEMFWNDEGYLRAFAHVSEEASELSFCCRKIPTELVDFWMPSYQILGTFSGEGEIHTRQSDLFADITLKSEAFTIGGSKEGRVCPLIGELEIHSSQNHMRASGQIKSQGGGEPLSWNVEMPLQFNPKPFSLTIDTEKPVCGKASGSCDITPFFSPFLQEDRTVEGLVTLDATLAGTLAHPLFSGHIAWHEGKLDVLPTGGVFSGIELEGKFSDSRLHIQKLHATDESKGKVSALGYIELSGARHFPFALEIEASDMEVIRRDFASSRASGKIAFFGDFTHAALEGTATVTGFDVNLASDFSSNLPLPDFIYVNTDKEDEPLVDENPFLLSFALELDIPKDCIHIEGRGIDSRWKGHIRLSGPHDELRLFGSLIATKGTFSFASKEFILKQGSCDFAGNPRTDSRLNVSVGAELPQINVDLNLRGTLKKPALTFTSTPAASQKEILSWILFSKPLSDVSAIEGLEIASALMELQYGRTTSSPIDQLKRSLGIDRIDIKRGQEETPGTPSNTMSVEVGKYLSKDVLLRLSKDVARAANRVAIEANVQKNLSLEAEIGDDQQGEMSLKFKHDY
jgi:hypothetical protein